MQTEKDDDKCCKIIFLKSDFVELFFIVSHKNVSETYVDREKLKLTMSGDNIYLDSRQNVNLSE